MMTISENDFRKLDLNLLVAFQVLVRERSVSRAAERLFLGQPAMSGALARLRQVFQDEILVRTGRGMEPTTKALALYARLTPALESIRATLFEQPAFEPAVESRCGAVSVGRTYLFPPLSSGGALMVRPWLRFHIPLIEPDVQISRIRLSDKTSRLCLACDAFCSS